MIIVHHIILHKTNNDCCLYRISILIQLAIKTHKKYQNIKARKIYPQRQDHNRKTKKEKVQSCLKDEYAKSTSQLWGYGHHLNK